MIPRDVRFVCRAIQLIIIAALFFWSIGAGQTIEHLVLAVAIGAVGFLSFPCWMHA